MKELWAFLLAYPLWVRVTIVVLQAVCALLLVAFKPKDTPQPKNIAPVTVAVGSNVGGIVIGRDVVIHTSTANSSTEELIRILSLRARKIIRELQPHYKYASVRSYVVRFEDLHKAHVEALKKGNATEAHEIVCQIHDISRELESDEFWARHRRKTPFTNYLLANDAFRRGPMLEWYVGKQPMEDLIAGRTPEQLAAAERKHLAFAKLKGSARVDITSPEEGAIVPRCLRITGHVRERTVYSYMLAGLLNTRTGHIGIDHIHELRDDNWSFQRLIGEPEDTGTKFVLFAFLSDQDIPVFPGSDISSLLQGRPNAQVTIFRA